MDHIKQSLTKYTKMKLRIYASTPHIHSKISAGVFMSATNHRRPRSYDDDVTPLGYYVAVSQLASSP